MLRSKLLFAGLFGLTAGLAAGCSQEISQSDVNKKEHEAAKAVADANNKVDKIQHETHKEVVDVERDRRDKVGKLEDKLQTTPDNPPKLRADISAADREATEKAEKIREDAAEKQAAIRDKAREKVAEANQTAVKYDAQQSQKQFVADHEKLLKDYDTNITLLRKSRTNLGGDALKIYDERLARVDDNRKKADTALGQLRSAKAEDWQTFRDEVRNAFANLKTSYDEAAQGRG